MHKMQLNNIFNQLANPCRIAALLSAGSGIKIWKSFADADRVLFTVHGSTDMHGVNSFVQTKTNVAVSKITSFHGTHANLMSLLWSIYLQNSIVYLIYHTVQKRVNSSGICVDILNNTCKSFLFKYLFSFNCSEISVTGRTGLGKLGLTDYRQLVKKGSSRAGCG